MRCKVPHSGSAAGAAGQALVYTLPQLARKICYLVAGRFCQLASLNEHRLRVDRQRLPAGMSQSFGPCLAPLLPVPVPR